MNSSCRHEWICEDCDIRIPFGQPELPAENFRSEQNGSRSCPRCGESMYFDEVGAFSSVSDFDGEQDVVD